MLRIIISVAIMSVVLFSVSFSQAGITAVPFLLISPETEANGMGEACVGSFAEDPLALMANPAHLGMQSGKNYFSFGYNYTDWLPQFQEPDLWYKTFGFNGGFNLQKISPELPNINFGAGYSRIYLNLGEFVETGQDPTPIRTFKAYETSDQYSLSLAGTYWVRFSAGITEKNIVSSLAPFNVQGQGREGVAKVHSYDYGFLLDIPVTDIISKIRGSQLELAPGLSPFLEFRSGLSMLNMGDVGVVYIDAAQADPLPRTARAGISYKLGFNVHRNDCTMEALSFKWSIDASDQLVTKYPEVVDSNDNIIRDAYWEYQKGMGNLSYVDNVLLGHGDDKTIIRKGWELNFFDLFSFRGGRFDEPINMGNRHFSTLGFGVRLTGIFKFIQLAANDNINSDVLRYILNHFDVRYNRSELTTNESDSPLQDTKFNSVNFMFMQ